MPRGLGEAVLRRDALPPGQRALRQGQTKCGGIHCPPLQMTSEDRSMNISPISPINNRLLANLSADDLLPLRARMNAVELPAGRQLHAAGEVLAYVYFPVTATVSLITALQDGTSLEVAAVGSEGMVGICAFLGGRRALGSAVVQSAGMVLRLPASVVIDAARQSSSLRQELLTYTQSLLTDMAQTTACLRHHRLEQQVCRWLLVHLDRQPGTIITATHDGIAQLLGVRREGVTAIALRLQRAGLIQYRRGRIELLNRAGLEARCCECYEAVRENGVRAPQPHIRAAPAPRYATASAASYA